MARNGSGVFAVTPSSVRPAVDGTAIETTPFNTMMAEVESGLSESLAKDGQTTATAVIPFAQGVKTDTVAELTAAAGVTVDSVLLKDGRVDTSKGSDIASATTTDIWAATGNFVHITGTTTIADFGTASKAGLWRIVEFDGILTLTHGSDLDCPGVADITTAAGDRAMIVANTTTTARVIFYERKDGMPQVGGSWTPAVAGSSTAGAQTYSVQLGRYVRVGSLVTAWFTITMTAKDGTTAGNVLITGLPFTASNVASLQQSGPLGYVTNATLTTNYTQLGLTVAPNTALIAVQQSGSAQSVLALPVSGLANGSGFAGSVTYRVG